MPLVELGSPEPINMVVDRLTLDAINQLAPQFPLSVQVLTPAGEFCRFAPINLAKDESYIRIYRQRHDLSQFWNQVNASVDKLRQR